MKSFIVGVVVGIILATAGYFIGSKIFVDEERVGVEVTVIDNGSGNLLEEVDVDKWEPISLEDNINTEAVIGFTNWYRENYRVLQSFRFIDKSRRVYSVDDKEVDRYINLLRLSGYVSKKYCDNRAEYFFIIAHDYKKYKISNDKDAEGFYDCDPTLLARNIDDILINKFTVDDIKSVESYNDFVIVTLNSEAELQFQLSEEDGKMVIDYIFGKKDNDARSCLMGISR